MEHYFNKKQKRQPTPHKKHTTGHIFYFCPLFQEHQQLVRKTLMQFLLTGSHCLSVLFLAVIHFCSLLRNK